MIEEKKAGVSHNAKNGNKTGFQLMGNKQFRMEFFLETSVCVDFSQYPFENIYVQFL